MEYVISVLVLAAGVVIGNGILMLLLVSGPVLKWATKKYMKELTKSMEDMNEQ